MLWFRAKKTRTQWGWGGGVINQSGWDHWKSAKVGNVCVKPVFNWADICFVNVVQGICWTWKKFGGNSWFLIGQTLLHKSCSGYLSNCNEAMFRVQKASLNVFWEHSPSSANLASDWLWAKIERQLSCGWGRNRNRNGWLCQCFTGFGGNWPICWPWEAQPCLGDPASY